MWFCLALAVFLVVPLSVANGQYAGSAYLLSLAIGLVGQWVWLRKGFLSWVPWAASFALYPAFLSYGGWGGQERGAPPELLVTGLAALLGIGVHFLTALWGLVPDNEDRWTYLPLKLGLRLGASRLLWVAGTYTVLVLVALAFAGTYVGLAQEPLQRCRRASISVLCHAAPTLAPAGRRSPRPRPRPSSARAASTRRPQGLHPGRGDQRPRRRRRRARAVVVAAQPGSGTFIASLSNNSPPRSRLTGCRPARSDLTSPGDFSSIPARGFVNLADGTRMTVTGDFAPGTSLT